MSGSTGIVYLIKHHVYLFVPYILSTNFLEAEPNLPRSDYLYALTTKAPTLPKNTLFACRAKWGRVVCKRNHARQNLSQHGRNVGYVINPIVKPCQARFDCAQSLLHGRQTFKLAVLAEAHFRACAIHANSPLRRSFR